MVDEFKTRRAIQVKENFTWDPRLLSYLEYRFYRMSYRGFDLKVYPVFCPIHQKTELMASAHVYNPKSYEDMFLEHDENTGENRGLSWITSDIDFDDYKKWKDLWKWKP